MSKNFLTDGDTRSNRDVDLYMDAENIMDKPMSNGVALIKTMN